MRMKKLMTDEERRKAISAYIEGLLLEKQRLYGRRFSQTKLAREIGIKESMMSKYINGEQLPGKETLAMIARYTGNLDIYDALGMDIRNRDKLLEMIEGWDESSEIAQEDAYRAWLGEGKEAEPKRISVA